MNGLIRISLWEPLLQEINKEKEILILYLTKFNPAQMVYNTLQYDCMLNNGLIQPLLSNFVTLTLQNNSSSIFFSTKKNIDACFLRSKSRSTANYLRAHGVCNQYLVYTILKVRYTSGFDLRRKKESKLPYRTTQNWSVEIFKGISNLKSQNR